MFPEAATNRVEATKNEKCIVSITNTGLHLATYKKTPSIVADTINKFIGLDKRMIEIKAFPAIRFFGFVDEQLLYQCFQVFF